MDPARRPSLTRRFLAFLVDGSLMALLVAASQWGFVALFGDALQARLAEEGALYRWTLLTASIPVWTYFILAEGIWGTTLGKRALGLRVESVEGAMGIAQALRRTAVRLLPWELAHVGLLIPLPVWEVDEPGFRWVLLAAYVLAVMLAVSVVRSPARQGWHDRAAGTVVVNR